MPEASRDARSTARKPVASRSNKRNKSARVDRVARKLAERYERQLDKAGVRKKPLRKTERGARARPLIAYDLETTRIEAGNPKPLYITAFSRDDGIGCDFTYSGRCHSPEDGNLSHLGHVLATYFLVPERNGARYVAWNGNNFDAYVIASALLQSREEFVIRPYLTRSKNLRGMRVDMTPEFFPKGYKKKRLSWEFLDGIAMTGIVKTKLREFLKKFAPDYQKLDAIDFETEEFDYTNMLHIEYAERDSEGLYYAIRRASAIVSNAFDVPLQPTIGNTGIRIFQREMPWNVAVWAPALEVNTVLRKYAYRGGFCVCIKRYLGPVWKYDINQAYAAAMRDSWLPAGTCVRKPKPTYNPLMVCALYRVRARNPRNIIPFYYTRIEDGLRAFATSRIDDTWITSTEYAQLKSELWDIDTTDCYFWNDQFTMREFVDKLEALRGAAADGPSGAEGTMIKAIGNNSYGKTVEKLDGLELVMSRECPEGFYEYQPEDDLLQHVFYRLGKPATREYHQPQIGTFITAHVRMELRRAALLAPRAFLYADTDCAMFSRPVDLPLDAKRYGYWKLEADGADYRIIGKKIYTSMDGKSRAAKGLYVKPLTMEDYERWFTGSPPVQKQVQRQNFVKVMTGMDMYIERVREGTGAGALGL